MMEDECRRLAAQLAGLSEQRYQMQATHQKLLLDQVSQQPCWGEGGGCCCGLHGQSCLVAMCCCMIPALCFAVA